MNKAHVEVLESSLCMGLYNLVNSSGVAVDHGPAWRGVVAFDFYVFDGYVAFVLYGEVGFHDVVEASFIPRKLQKVGVLHGQFLS